jgi:hypothetical protein
MLNSSFPFCNINGSGWYTHITYKSLYFISACYFTALKTVKYRKNLFLFSWRVKRRREQLVRGTEQSKNILLHFLFENLSKYQISFLIRKGGGVGGTRGKNTDRLMMLNKGKIFKIHVVHKY